MASDSQAAIAMAERAEISSRSKHIDLRHHWIRDQVATSTLELRFVESENNLADLFTKALPKERHEDLTARIHVLPPADQESNPQVQQVQAPLGPRGGVKRWPMVGAKGGQPREAPDVGEAP
jgi:hypothetical protein